VAPVIVYLTLALGPLGLLLGRRETRSLGRDLAVVAVPMAAVAAGATLLGGLGAVAAAWVGAITGAYGGAWCGLHARLGRGRVAAVTVACLAPLVVAITLAPNVVVESQPGQLVHPVAPLVLVHVDPVVVLGHRFLEDEVLVRNYFYYQAAAPVPPAGRMLLIYLAVTALGVPLRRRPAPVRAGARAPAGPGAAPSP
jgi:hypothetical protein